MKKTIFLIVLCFANLFHPVEAVESNSNYKNLTGRQRLELITRLFEKSKSGFVLSTNEQNFLRSRLRLAEILRLRKLIEGSKEDVHLFRQSNDLSKFSIICEEPPYTKRNWNKKNPWEADTNCGKYSVSRLSSSDKLKASISLKLRFLRRLDDDRCVGIVYFRPNNPPLLNPTFSEKLFFKNEIDYGPIPDLKDLSLAEANILWNGAKLKESAQQINKTFELEYKIPILKKKESCLLDVKFVNNNLKEYRIRSREIKNPGWVKVD